MFRSVCSLFLKFKFSAKGRSEVPEGLKQKPGWIVRVNPNLDYSQLDYPQLDFPQLDYPQLDYPQLDYPQLDYPHLDCKLRFSSFLISKVIFAAVTLS